MKQLIESTKDDVVVVQTFRKVYPESIHVVSYYTGEYGTPTWNSKTPLHKRYILTMQMPITINGNGTKITKHEDSHFFLTEIRQVNGGNGSSWTLDTKSVAEFGMDKWKTLVKQNGDFGALGIDIKRDAPVKGFDRYWKYKVNSVP